MKSSKPKLVGLQKAELKLTRLLDGCIPGVQNKKNFRIRQQMKIACYPCCSFSTTKEWTAAIKERGSRRPLIISVKILTGESRQDFHDYKLLRIRHGVWSQ